MESVEHVWIGDQVVLKYPGDTEKAAKGNPLWFRGSRLTYGQIVALGGDFYGVVGAPISTAAEPERAFEKAFDTLTASPEETKAILAVMDEEAAAIEKARAEGHEPSTAYAILGDSLSMRWNEITGGGTVGHFLGRYLQLAAENWDHFTTYAVTAYKAGHAVAMRHAASANHLPPGTQPDTVPGLKAMILEEAYAMNAFADHFLTDLFSAGHLRAPRKELYDEVTTPVPGFSGALGSILCRCMHDEDSRYGLHVHNLAGDSWKAYGDKRLLDKVSVDNRRIVSLAVQASADDVFAAFSGEPKANSALRYIPDLERVADVSARENFSPLFRRQDGATTRRNEVGNREDYSWTTDWWGWSTYALLLGVPPGYSHAKVHDLATGAFLGWLGSGGGNYVEIATDEKNAHGVAWAFDKDGLYIRKETSGGDRYLGLSDRSYAGWGVAGPGGWWNPVLYNPDRTISLKEDPKRKLYVSKDEWLSWSDGSSTDKLVTIDLPLEGPAASC